MKTNNTILPFFDQFTFSSVPCHNDHGGLMKLHFYCMKCGQIYW